MSVRISPREAALGPRSRRRIDWLPYLLALPLTIFLGAVLLVPIGRGIVSWFFSIDFLAPEQGKFVGLANYQRMVQDPGFWHSAATTLLLSLIHISEPTRL